MRCGCRGGPCCGGIGPKARQNQHCCGVAVQTKGEGAPAPPIARCYFTERTAAPCAPAFAVSSNLTAGLSLSFSKSVGVGGAT